MSTSDRAESKKQPNILDGDKKQMLDLDEG